VFVSVGGRPRICLILAIAPLRAIGRSTDGRPSPVTKVSPLVGVVASALQLPAQLQVASVPAVQTGQASGVQAADIPASGFEVASVKPRTSGLGMHRAPIVSGDELTWDSAQLQWVIERAYRVDQYHLSGEPSWVGGGPSNGVEYFDITAKAPAPASADQMRLMLRQLLVDRFHLVAHTETRNTPIYELVLADLHGALGPNLHQATTDCATLRAAAAERTARGGPPPGPGNLPCNLMGGSES
jgi:hypothetical protein